MYTAVITALLWATLTFSASATPLFVKCVQNQLISLGHDPGPVDGQVGPKTRSAISEIVKSDSSFDSLPELTSRYVVTWCRRLGELGKDTLAHMPSTKSSVFQVDDEDGAFLLLSMVSSLAEIQNFTLIYYDTTLASKIDVVAGNNYRKINKRLRRLQKNVGEVPQPMRFTSKRCRDWEQLQAFSTLSQITLCFPKDTTFDNNWNKKQKHFIKYVMAHEYFHQVQREFVAAKDAIQIVNGSKLKPYMRPSWLMEGSADVFAREFLEKKIRIPYSKLEAYTNSLKFRKTLSEISKLDNLYADEDYRVSEFATWILVEKYGMNAIFNYWEYIGMGVSPETSFEQVFEMTLEQYYDAFEDIRLDYGKVKAYIGAKP